MLSRCQDQLCRWGKKFSLSVVVNVPSRNVSRLLSLLDVGFADQPSCTTRCTPLLGFYIFFVLEPRGPRSKAEAKLHFRGWPIHDAVTLSIVEKGLLKRGGGSHSMPILELPCRSCYCRTS